jgi:hypothetical protein
MNTDIKEEGWIEEENLRKTNSFLNKKNKCLLIEDDIISITNKNTFNKPDSKISIHNLESLFNEILNPNSIKNYTSSNFHNSNQHLGCIKDEIFYKMETTGIKNESKRKKTKKNLKKKQLKSYKKHSSYNLIKDYMKTLLMKYDLKGTLLINLKKMKIQVNWKWEN